MEFVFTKDEVKRINAMVKLGMDIQEAREVIMEDREVNQMSMKEIKAEMTPEEQEAVRAATKTGTRKSATARRATYKPSDEKTAFFQGLKTYLENTYGAETVTILKENKLILLWAFTSFFPTPFQ